MTHQIKLVVVFAVYVALACFMREKVLIKSLFQQARWKYRHLLIGCVISTLASKGDYYDISDDLPQFEEY